MSLAERFKAGPVFSLEVFPPKREGDVEALYRVFDEVAPLRPDFISVTYGAGGGNVGLHFEITRRLIQLGITPLPHFTCVGQSRDQVRIQLDRLAGIGVKNILALRGDPPKGQAVFEPRPDGFAHASDLTAFIRSNYGFCVGGAFYPEKHPQAPDAAADLGALKTKVAAGADFLISQMFFDNRFYFEFVERARAAGISVPLVPGVFPVLSARFFDRSFDGVSFPDAMKRRFAPPATPPDAAAEREIGLGYAAEQGRELIQKGAPGLHFYVMNRSETAHRLWSALGLPASPPLPSLEA